eukprot:scaffold6575_cov303-Ochromonas_danica.AAC.2
MDMRAKGDGRMLLWEKPFITYNLRSHIPPILSGEDLLTRESWQLSQSLGMTFDELEVIKQHVAYALLQPQPAGMMAAARSAP